MSFYHISVNQNDSITTSPLTDRFGSLIRDYLKVLTQPKTMLKTLGIGLPSELIIAKMLVESKLTKIPEIKDVKHIQHNDSIHMLAYVEQPNEEVESKVYSIYGDILDMFPETDVNVRIIELYGRTVEEMPKFNF